MAPIGKRSPVKRPSLYDLASRAANAAGQKLREVVTIRTANKTTHRRSNSKDDDWNFLCGYDSEPSTERQGNGKIRPKTLFEVRREPAKKDISKFRLKYEVCTLLGIGAFSNVFQVRETFGDRRYMACKVLELAPKGQPAAQGQTTLAEAKRELEILRVATEHPRLLKLHDFFLEGDNLYMVTNLSKGGTLEKALMERGNFAEEDAQRIISGILHGLAHLHANAVAHRDLKLDNILILEESDLSSVQIADFGMAKKLHPNNPHTVCGSPMYMAPEVLNPTNNDSDAAEHSIAEYGVEADVWSCGVILYYLLSGYPPFSSRKVYDLFVQIRSGAYNFQDPVWELISRDARDLVRRMLVVDPRKRISIKHALQHVWLSGC